MPTAPAPLNLVVSQAEARVLDVAPGTRGRWPRRAVALIVLLAIALAAGMTWLRVARTIRHPHAITVTKQPHVNALAWSGRVFVDAASFKRWLEARDTSYAAWARQHPRARALLERRRGAGR